MSDSFYGLFLSIGFIVMYRIRVNSRNHCHRPKSILDREKYYLKSSKLKEGVKLIKTKILNDSVRSVCAINLILTSTMHWMALRCSFNFHTGQKFIWSTNICSEFECILWVSLILWILFVKIPAAEVLLLRRPFF